MPGLRSGAVDESTPESPTAPETPSRPSRPALGVRTRRAVALVGALVLTGLLAWAAALVLDASSFPSTVAALRDPQFEVPAMLPSVAVLWVVLLLILAVIGRLWISMGVFTALTAMVAMVNSTKMELRNDPVFPSDVVFLGQPGFLFDMVPKASSFPRSARTCPAAA
jgi:hypothetical protein